MSAEACPAAIPLQRPAIEKMAAYTSTLRCVLAAGHRGMHDTGGRGQFAMVGEADANVASDDEIDALGGKHRRDKVTGLCVCGDEAPCVISMLCYEVVNDRYLKGQLARLLPIRYFAPG